MNEIVIFAPRWRDKTILVADWKIMNNNRIVITAQRKDGSKYYPNPFMVTGAKLRSYPIENMSHGKMRRVPLQEILG